MVRGSEAGMADGPRHDHYIERLQVLMIRTFKEMDANDFVDERTEEVKIENIDDLGSAWQTNKYLDKNTHLVDVMINNISGDIEDGVTVGSESEDGLFKRIDDAKSKIQIREEIYVWGRGGPRVLRMTRRGRLRGAFKA